MFSCTVLMYPMHNAIAVLYHENRCERWGGVKGEAGGQWYKVWVGFGYRFWSEGSQMGHIHMKIGTWVPYLTGSPKFMTLVYLDWCTHACMH